MEILEVYVRKSNCESSLCLKKVSSISAEWPRQQHLPLNWPRAPDFQEIYTQVQRLPNLSKANMP